MILNLSSSGVFVTKIRRSTFVLGNLSYLGKPESHLSLRKNTSSEIYIGKMLQLFLIPQSPVLSRPFFNNASPPLYPYQ